MTTSNWYVVCANVAMGGGDLGELWHYLCMTLGMSAVSYACQEKLDKQHDYLIKAANNMHEMKEINTQLRGDNTELSAANRRLMLTNAALKERLARATPWRDVTNHTRSPRGLYLQARNYFDTDPMPELDEQ